MGIGDQAEAAWTDDHHPSSRDETDTIVARTLTWVEARAEPSGAPGAEPTGEVAGTRVAEPDAGPVSLA